MSGNGANKAAPEATGAAPAQAEQRLPRPWHNGVTWAGLAVALISLINIIFLFLLDLFAAAPNPYLGLVAYLLLPIFLSGGLLLMLIGVLRARRRRQRQELTAEAAYPRLDFNQPRQRRLVAFFGGFGLIFTLFSVIGSYRAYQYSESVAFCGQVCHTVMKPQFTAYQVAPHARVRCVDCHVGSGADFYLRAKLSGLYQVYAAAFDEYPRPIPTPVHNLRPAQETCEQCHWPAKFFGPQLKIFNYFGPDEANTPRQVRLLVNTGGGSPVTGRFEGIHWHMNLANEITFIATDPQRQAIPWIRLKDQAGQVTEYFAPGVTLTPAEIERAPKRRMDCVDCHNRPSHIYLPPTQAVDRALMAGQLDSTLPYIKQQAVEVLSRPYTSTPAALQEIAQSLETYYQTNYPALYATRRHTIQRAGAELQRLYQTYFFPEMKTDWQTHPNNISHLNSAGCFRCHDGQHTSKEGKVIRNDCNLCHTVLDQQEGGRPLALVDGAFQHPVELGPLTELKCTDCHSGRGLQ